jgi:hypothetical protein
VALGDRQHAAELERLEARRRQLSFQLDQQQGPDDLVSEELDAVEDQIGRIHRDAERQRLAREVEAEREREAAAARAAVLRKNLEAQLEEQMRERLVAAGVLQTEIARFLSALAQFGAASEAAYRTTVELGAPKRRLQGHSMVGVYLSEVLAGKLVLGPRQQWAKGRTLVELISGQLTGEAEPRTKIVHEVGRLLPQRRLVREPRGARRPGRAAGAAEGVLGSRGRSV